MAGENISYIVAFTAGFFTFLTPCILPLIPSFIAYITGVSFADLKDAAKRGEVMRKTAAHSLLFILGFTLIFVLLGLTATLIGKALFNYQNVIRTAGGVLIIFFGIYLTGIIKLDFLAKERRFNVSVKRATYIGSFIVGVTFAAAWTPCVGALLGSILALAGTKQSALEGAKLLTAYSLGIGVPFFITGLAVNYFLEYFNKLKNVIKYINIVGGIFLVLVGILVMTNYFETIAGRLASIFIK